MTSSIFGKLYDWQRFWQIRDVRSGLSHESTAEIIEQSSKLKCLVFLGASASGKSTELEKIYRHENGNLPSASDIVQIIDLSGVRTSRTDK